MKQLKEIFGRKTSIWLAIELVLVTCACWWAFDPVIVTSYVTHLPMGCDIDRIVKLEVATSLTNDERFSRDIQNSLYDEEAHLAQRVMEMDEVAVAYRTRATPLGFGQSYRNNFFHHDSDSLLCWLQGFEDRSRMFEAYGIHSLTPEVSTSELTHDCEFEKTLILTRSVAMALFGTIDVAGRRIYSNEVDYNDDGQFEHVRREWLIRAVVEDVRREIFDRDYATMFVLDSGPVSNATIIIRLRDGVDARRFVQEREREMQASLVTEHLYVRSVQTAVEASEQYVDSSWMGRQTHRNLLIAAFFAINLAFGVFGTLLMYTRQRREEAGVRLAFGATRWSVFWGFIREAWLLTTVSVLLGCIIYFQFAASRGLCDDFSALNPAVHYWFDDFGTHFLVVSVIVYLIILCAVLIATAIPAWRICRSEITVALRDE